ncbi:MAG: DUF4905 domain-containing protein [Thermonemataceae bacterium]
MRFKGGLPYILISITKIRTKPLYQKFPIHFVFHTTQPIWRVWLDEKTEHWVIEHRNATQKTSLFSVGQVQNKKVLVQEESLGLDWWASIAAVWDNHLIWTLYQDHHNPLQQGFMVYNTTQEQIIWEKGGHTFYQLYRQPTQVVGYSNRLEPIQLIHWDLVTGLEQPAAKEEDFKTQQLFPARYSAKQPHFDTVATYVKQAVGEDVHQQIDYLEIPHCILIGYYDAALFYKLLAIDLSGKILAKESVYQATNGIAIGNFFVFKNLIFIVKNKIELVTYSLNELLGGV